MGFQRLQRRLAFHIEQRHALADVVVELAGEAAALVFLRRHQHVGQGAQLFAAAVQLTGGLRHLRGQALPFAFQQMLDLLVRR